MSEDIPNGTDRSIQRRQRLTLQGLALGTMLLVPVALYFVARAGLEHSVLALLVTLGVGMLLAAWVG
jgi:hypothetical protein